MNNIFTPTVTLVDGTPRTTSLNVAEVFGKRHDVVIRGIRDLQDKCPEEFTAHNFVVSEYTDSTGRKLPMYTMTRDGFTLLVMGFTGKEALAWKIRYIEAFNAMEKKLREEEKALPAKRGRPKKATIYDDVREMHDMERRLRLLAQTVQLHGLHGIAADDDTVDRKLTELRNAHIRQAADCLLVAKCAITAALA